MDAGDRITEKVMWKPDRTRVTKMDMLRKRINEKHNVKLGSSRYNKPNFLFSKNATCHISLERSIHQKHKTERHFELSLLVNLLHDIMCDHPRQTYI